MKKRMLSVIGVVVMLFISNVKVVLANETDKKVAAMEISNVFNWIDVNDSFFDATGAHGIRKYNVSDPYANGVGVKQQFNVSNGKVATIEFQIPDYNASDRTLKDNHMSSSKPYDIFLVNVDTGFNSRIRIWGGNSAKEGETSSWIEFCESKTSSWEKYSGGYVSGVFTDDSAFKLSFDTENFIKFNCEWQENKMVAFEELGEIGAKKQAYLDFMAENYKNATCIEFWFAHESLVADTYNEIVVKSINGQSYSVDNDSMYIDDVNPVVSAIQKTNKEEVYLRNNEYTLRVEKWLGVPNTKTTFFMTPINDYGSVIDDLVDSVKVMIKHSSESEYSEVGKVDTSASIVKEIKFGQAGSYSMYVQVMDRALNVGKSDVIEIQVIKGYEIVLSGEVPTSGKVSESITIPLATASDENGVEREVTIVVEDSIGNKVNLVDNSFVPTTQGIHYVIYSSSYIDSLTSEKKEATKIEREIIVTKADNNPPVDDGGDTKPNEDKGCFGEVMSSVGMLSILMGSLVLIKKKKHLGE